MRRLIYTFNNFVIKEKSNNIKKIVSKYDAPYGIIFDGENKILVGDMHQTPIELSKDWDNPAISSSNKLKTHSYVAASPDCVGAPTFIILCPFKSNPV